MSNLPSKLNRKAVKLNFTKVSETSWKYLFDHEKENGLAKCRTAGWGIKRVWYATRPLMKWLIDHGYYATHKEFSEPKPISPRSLGTVSSIHRIAG